MPVVDAVVAVAADLQARGEGMSIALAVRVGRDVDAVLGAEGAGSLEEDEDDDESSGSDGSATVAGSMARVSFERPRLRRAERSQSA